jgi:gamma-glutamyl phosphate reductase
VRVYLQTKQEITDRIQTLEQRMASLQDNLRRVDSLRDELATREAELKALESGSIWPTPFKFALVSHVYDYRPGVSVADRNESFADE